MGIADEISVLKGLVRVTCQSADHCAAAARACGDGYHAMVVDELCDDRRRLVVDLVRCLLLRGLPVPEVRSALTCAPHPMLTGVGLQALWIDVEIAEKKLHEMLRSVVESSVLSEPVRELLSLHFLRFKLHHDQLDRLMEAQSTVADNQQQLRPLHA